MKALAQQVARLLLIADGRPACARKHPRYNVTLQLPVPGTGIVYRTVRTYWAHVSKSTSRRSRNQKFGKGKRATSPAHIASSNRIRETDDEFLLFLHHYRHRRSERRRWYSTVCKYLYRCSTRTVPGTSTTTRTTKIRPVQVRRQIALPVSFVAVIVRGNGYFPYPLVVLRD